MLQLGEPTMMRKEGGTEASRRRGGRKVEGGREASGKGGSRRVSPASGTAAAAAGRC